MSSLNEWLKLGVPAGWGDVWVRTAKVAVVAFLALVLKEWMDTREWDLRACAIDGSWIAGGTLVLNAMIRGLTPRPRSRPT